jgi:polysaccharide export outer membrane protein
MKLYFPILCSRSRYKTLDRALIGRRRVASLWSGFASLVVCSLTLAACSWFPASGPTAAQLADSVEDDAGRGLKILDVTPGVMKILVEDKPVPIESLPEPSMMPWSDLIGIGDSLSVIVLEAGPGLFPQPLTAGSSPGATFSLLVDNQGQVFFPYAGRIPVAGHTPIEVGTQIEHALIGKANQPQVLVTVTTNRSNTVVITGDVKAPGRYPLSPRGESLLDIITLAGGPTQLPTDTTVHFAREQRLSEFPLTKVVPYASENVALAPDDRIVLVSNPRSFLVFGATGRVADVPFGGRQVSLAQAVARASGPADVQADPTAVYLFRFENHKVARALGLPPQEYHPVIYHLDLNAAGSYFDMGLIDVHDKDLIYVANARINLIQKFMNLAQSLLTPLLLGIEVF